MLKRQAVVAEAVGNPLKLSQAFVARYERRYGLAKHRDFGEFLVRAERADQLGLKSDSNIVGSGAAEVLDSDKGNVAAEMKADRDPWAELRASQLPGLAYLLDRVNEGAG